MTRTADHFRFRQLRPHRLRFLRQGHVYILGVDCTDDEWHKIEVIPCELFSRHARWCSGLIDYDGWFPRVRVVCFGEHCGFGDVPDFMQFRFAQGEWKKRYRVAKIIFGPVPMQNAIFHELTHAFMDLAGEHFQCPRPLEEGYALIIDYWLGDSRDPRYANNVMRAGRGRHRSLTPEQTMTIWEAFTLDPGKYQPVAGSPGNHQLLQSICLAGVWLVLWLQKMSETRPCCGHILSILRRRRIATPVEVYGLLQELTQMNSSEMEASYREFATTANPLDFIPRPAQLDQIRPDGGNGTAAGSRPLAEPKGQAKPMGGTPHGQEGPVASD